MPGLQIENNVWEMAGDLQSVFNPRPLLPRNHGKTSCCYLNRSCVPASLWKGKRPPDISYAGAEKAPFVKERSVWMCSWEGHMWVWGRMKSSLVQFCGGGKKIQITCGSWVVPSTLSLFLTIPCPICPSGLYIVSRVSVVLLLNWETGDLKSSPCGTITSEHTISHLSVSQKCTPAAMLFLWALNINLGRNGRSVGHLWWRKRLMGSINNPGTKIRLLLWLLCGRCTSTASGNPTASPLALRISLIDPDAVHLTLSFSA